MLQIHPRVGFTLECSVLTSIEPTRNLVRGSTLSMQQVVIQSILFKIAPNGITTTRLQTKATSSQLTDKLAKSGKIILSMIKWVGCWGSLRQMKSTQGNLASTRHSKDTSKTSFLTSTPKSHSEKRLESWMKVVTSSSVRPKQLILTFQFCIRKKHCSSMLICC